jgi:4-hydroxybenzoate polyprenyltransferase
MIKNYLSLIKFSHTIFALPFAIVGFILGLLDSSEIFDIKKLVLIILCMVFARSAAMAFNRYVDRDIDVLNSRSAEREIPKGIISSKAALLFIIINCILFVATTYFINSICFYLSPVALLVVLGYSFTKRFTFLCHLVLGLGLSLAPIGAYLAVTGYFGVISVLFGISVLFWVSGFDIIYALQDEYFDKEQRLYSIPSYYGGNKALVISRILHLISIVSISLATIFAFQNYQAIGILSILGLIIFSMLVFYQHTLVKVNDLSKVNMAFFTTNGIASVIYGFLFIIDYFAF